MGEEVPRSNRDVLLERMRVQYPDREFADGDDESLYGSVNEDYAARDAELQGYKDREQGMIDMFNADPRSANFLTAWRRGEDPVIQLVRLFGPELRESLDDPSKMEALEQAHQEYMDRLEGEKAADAEVQENLKKSLAGIDAIAAREGLDEAAVTAGMEKLVGIIRDANRGIYDPETLILMVKALNHDDDVAAARGEGEIAGRNAKIDERLRVPSDDAVPQLSGGAAVNGEGGGRPQSIFDIAAQAQ